MRVYKLFTRFGYMRNWLSIFSVLIIMTLGMFSCKGKQSADVLSREFDGEIWRHYDYITASYNVVRAPMTADLVLDVEVSDVFPDVYPYPEADKGILSFVMAINAPDGSRRTREYTYRLKDNDGNFKAEKVDGYYHYSLPLISEMSFRENGNYEFKIESTYPKEPLYGIKRLSISCLQIKK